MEVLMKKLLIISMSLVLAVSLSGCFLMEDAPEAPEEKEVPVSNEAPVEAPPEAPPATPEKAQPEKPPATPEKQDPDDNPDIDDTPGGLFPFSFTAKDLYGNTVTEETIGKKQLFFVHLWGTWCPPCIDEMPELAVVAEEFSDVVGFIGLLDDYSANLEGAVNIAKSSGKPDSFINIDAYHPELIDLLELLYTGYVPTTIIITPDGEVLETLIGAYGAEYALFLDEFLEIIYG